MLGCDFEGAICVNSDGVEVTGSCTKYYALCTEQHIQTAPIEVNNPETTSCRDGIIVAATNCVAPTTCTVLGIHCTDAQGTEVANSCTSYFRECENGVLTEVMPVARGSKCLNNAIVLNSACSSDCTFTGIQCTNGAGEFVNTYCTGYFVECNDGAISEPQEVPEGTSCYMNNLVITGTCPNPSCSFTGIRCSDASGVIINNACTTHFVECDDGVVTKAMPVADGTKCYNSEIVLNEVCTGATCTGAGIVCTDVSGVIQTDVCTGYYRQCVNGVYGVIEDVPAGSMCKNGEILLKDTCTSPCTDIVNGVRTKRCTTSSGIPITGTCTKFYQSCYNSTFDNPVENTDPGMSCYNGELIAASQCTSANYECDFTGIRCSTADGVLTTNTCTEYYVQCEFGSYTAPLKTANGTRCFNDEQVAATSCTATCDYEGIRCADLSGNVITNSCTSYFVECDNGLQIKPMPVAEGTKCLNGEIVHNSNCTASVCTQGDLVCSDASGIVDNTTCTDYFMQCFSGLFIEPQPVAYGTKCLQGKIVLASACTGAACDFEGIRCSDANGVIYENMCQSYFVQCNDGSFTAPMAVANGTRCYNGNLVNTAECSYQNCDFEGIKCTDANGVVYTNTCTSYFVECGESGTSQPMPVADGTRCYGGTIVSASYCSSAECNYEGIKCADANGNVYTDTCTSYYVECDNGSVTAPRPVANGTRCRNGEQVNANSCSGAQCDFEGIRCTDANNVYYPDTCTNYYTQCDNGYLMTPREVPAGTRCLRNELVLSSVCSGVTCDYEGIRCTDSYGTVQTDTCTSYYVECDNGSVTAPMPVADGTRCRNSEIILSANCTGTQCSFTGIQCTDSEGAARDSSCTSYYVECDDGYISAPRSVADGTRCLRGEIVNTNQCQGTHCIDDTIVCVDAEGTQHTDVCTNYYAECDHGYYTAPRKVANGTRCRNGEQVLAGDCPGVECTTTAIRCSDSGGVAYDDVCTSFFMKCDNGKYTSPMPVAPGTYCLNGELVLPFNCTGTNCDFTGIQCTDAAGTYMDTTCTNYFVECNNGHVTNPMVVPNGAMCLAGSIVLSSSCPGAQCSYTGYRCVTADGTVATNTCTSYFVECVDGTQSRPQAVAAGTRCYNNEFVLESFCTSPQCSFTGVRCTDSRGVAVTGTCSDYYVSCENGVQVGPTHVSSDQKCLNDALVSSTTCTPKECDFTGFICSTSDGTLAADTCTSYFVECVDYKYSSPIAVASGSRCYNQQIVSAEAAQCGSSTSCDFDGILCADSNGKIIANRCSNYYVMCSNGAYTKPRLTADGTKCFNNEQVITSVCDGIECSFSGIICVDNVGSFVMNTCTTQYAECENNSQVIKDVATGKACYNSQIISDTDSTCRVTVEVQENKMKGIRGRK